MWISYRSCAAFFFVYALFSTNAIAATISVSQESAPGAGDFASNVLGTIKTFDTTGTLSGFYNYSANQYNGPASLTADQSHVFLVSSRDGLGIFLVHDNAQPDGDGGQAEMQMDLTGDTAGFLVYDDPEGGRDNYNTTGTQFQMQNIWNDGVTDGVVIGTLDGNWSVDIQFADLFDADGVALLNLSSWVALSSDGLGGQTELGLALEEGRRVRLSSVPVPAALWLFGSGLIGLIGAARKKGYA